MIHPQRHELHSQIQQEKSMERQEGMPHSQEEPEILLRAYLLSLFPDIEVVFGFENSLPAPARPYVRITPVDCIRLSTPRHEQIGDSSFLIQPLKLVEHMAFYGEKAAWQIRRFMALFATDHGFEWFKHHTRYSSPLYIEEIKQGTQVNESALFENGWVCEVSLQHNVCIPYTGGSFETSPIPRFHAVL
ncbi:phage neck terminator protein [Entomobacter blattae]|uniref:Phage neck terminator protein gp12-like domain-containing protein n=1 Tax=Entomobacter blattae TaxID=2762277 RepID=A0A7H1NR68_9PROT|nr:hypothetical protein [Entomobacter blattae]QNT78278.1 hypothetical protein JGUZn3_10500 [Entomobacter blattae]